MKTFKQIVNEGSTEVTELVLFITNDSDLNRQRVQPIIKNLQKKFKKGAYQKQLAIKLWKYLADDGAKKYAKEVAADPTGWNRMFTPADRKAVAIELEDFYRESVEEG